MTVVVTSYRALSTRLAGRTFPREPEPLAMAHSKGGRLLCRTGATGSAWCCSLGTELLVASPAGAEALRDQVLELWEETSRMDSVGTEGPSLPSDVNLQKQYNALIAKEVKLVPWG